MPISPDRHSFVSKASSTTNAMHVCVRFRWEIIVEHDIHALNVKPTSTEIGGDHNTRFELLELVVSSNSVSQKSNHQLENI
jgi:hypothetical protein